MMNVINEIIPPNHSHNLFVPIDGSLCRRARDVIGVICEIWRSVQSYFIKIESESVQINSRDQNTLKNYMTAYDCLRKGLPLQKVALSVYMESLRNHKDNFQYCTTYCSERQSLDPLPDLNNDQDKVVFPIAVEGTCGRRPHVLAVVVDPSRHSIEFYDPKGLTLRDRDQDTVIGNKGRLMDLMRNIWGKYAVDHEWDLQENTTRHQDDGYNSGVYVCDYITRRCNEESCKDIWADGLTFAQASKDTRENMIAEINNFYNQLK